MPRNLLHPRIMNPALGPLWVLVNAGFIILGCRRFLFNKIFGVASDFIDVNKPLRGLLGINGWVWITPMIYLLIYFYFYISTECPKINYALLWGLISPLLWSLLGHLMIVLKGSWSVLINKHQDLEDWAQNDGARAWNVKTTP